MGQLNVTNPLSQRHSVLEIQIPFPLQLILKSVQLIGRMNNTVGAKSIVFVSAATGDNVADNATNKKVQYTKND
jgi:hypothetical protein